MLTVRFPAMLHAKAGRELVIDESPPTVAALLEALERRVPGLAVELEDPIFNVAVNDEMLLHDTAAHTLNDGDIVEFVPSIAGG